MPIASRAALQLPTASSIPTARAHPSRGLLSTQLKRVRPSIRRPHTFLRCSGQDQPPDHSEVGSEMTLEREGLLQDGKGKEVDYVRTAVLFLFPALGGLLFGFDIGATSGAIVSLTSAATSNTSWGPELSNLGIGAVVSSSLLGALMGSIGAFFVGDKLGRKKELFLAAGLYGIGAAIVAASPDYTILIIGRVLYGLGIGFAMHAAPAYIAETAPVNLRGLLISLKEAFIVGGILLGYLVSYLFVDANAGWRLMYGISLPLAVIFGLGMVFLPESARWLVLSGASTEAVRKALTSSKGKIDMVDEVVSEEIESMQEVAGKEVSTNVEFQKLFQKRNWRPLYIGLSLMFFQQITGQPSVLYYAATIFQDAGFSGGQAAAGVSVILGFFKLVMTSIAAFTVDQLGRKPLLLVGVSGMVASLTTLGFLQLFGATGLSWVIWTNVVALLLYVGCYQVSFGPISWLIAGEVFPLDVRGPAVALATFVNFGTNFLVSLVLPVVQKGIGLGPTYLLFAALGVAAIVSIALAVVETKGKSLEEIEALWD